MEKGSTAFSDSLAEIEGRIVKGTLKNLRSQDN